MANLFTEENLDTWIKLQRNVLFTGKHGVGKTAKVIDAFNRNGLNWMYFSASTMDPWTDFVGVPRVKTDEYGDFIEYILPKLIADDKVEAFFFDEFNRAPKRVRNAVMELIQFKSINGRKLNSLKIVWAARNPEDEEETYDVEKLDPAQIDRFPVQCEVPYELDIKYLKGKYGDDWALAAKEWWDGLKELKDHVSPRKLDDALSFQRDGGDLAHVLPPKANISALRTRLNRGAYLTHLQDAISRNDPDELRKFLLIENNWNGVLNYILDNNKMYYLFEYAPKDKLANLIRNNTAVYKYVVTNYETIQVFKDVIDSLLTINAGDKFTKKLEKEILAKIPNHPIAASVTRNIVKSLKKHDLNYTQGRRSVIYDLQKELRSNGKTFGVESFDDSEIKWIMETISKVAKSTHKSGLKNFTHFWEVLDQFLIYQNKKNNIKGKTLDSAFKTQPGFVTITDWTPLEKLGWTI
jgi:hypothetical protein